MAKAPAPDVLRIAVAQLNPTVGDIAGNLAKAREARADAARHRVRKITPWVEERRGEPYALVRSYMAHHQGMSLLAFAHVLLDQPMQRRFMSDPLVRATELLLQERVPKQGATLHPHAAEVSAAARPPGADVGSIMRVFTEPNTRVPEVHLLSNGRYHVMATHAGGSSSRWRDLAITRWREDSTTDSWGTFIYLRDRDSGKYWSTAHQPTLRRADHYEAIFVQGRAEYRRRDQAIEAHTERERLDPAVGPVAPGPRPRPDWACAAG